MEFLNSHKNELNIKSITINDSTMEQVFINLFTYYIQNQNQEVSPNILFDESEDIKISFDIDYENIIKSIQSESNKPSIFYHIYLLVKKRLISNFHDIYFYILQFLTPIILTIIGCLISKFVVNMIDLSTVNTIQQFSKEHPFIIPIYHQPNIKKHELNKMFITMINDFQNFDIDTYIKYSNKNKIYRFCEFDTKNICKLNNDSIDQIRKFSNNFLTLKNFNNSYYIQLVHNCNLNKFLIRTKYQYSYKR